MRSTTMGRSISVVATMLVLAGCSASRELVPRAFEASRCTAEVTWPAVDGAMGEELLRLTNEHRQSIGMIPFTIDPDLQRAAEWKVRHMAEYGYLAHSDPAPPFDRTAQERIEECGFPMGGWENLAWGSPTPADALASWLDDLPHRENIEIATNDLAGIAVATASDGEPYWAQIFSSTERKEKYGTPTPPATQESESPGDGLGGEASPSPSEPMNDGSGDGTDADPEPESYPSSSDGTNAQEESSNSEPVAVDDRKRVRTGTRVRISVLANDSDPDGDDLDLIDVSGARFGRVSIDAATDSLFYRARRGTAGKRERLTYRIEDPSGASAQARLVIIIR